MVQLQYYGTLAKFLPLIVTIPLLPFLGMLKIIPGISDEKIKGGDMA
jgi:hypothetical protein